MKALLAISVLLLSLVTVGTVFAWEPPDTCLDEHREISGNQGSPCRLAFPPIENVVYRVIKDYPNCVEELVFDIPGIVPTEDSDVEYYIGDKNKRLGMSKYTDGYWEYTDSQLVLLGYTWGLNSRIDGTSHFGNPSPSYPYITIKPASRWSTGIPPLVLRPVADVASLVNSCLALVRQELEDIEHAARLAEEEAAAEARRAAERHAESKLREQAEREAAIRATIAAEELAAAQENLETARQTELIRTQTLQARLLHEEAMAGLTEDIVRIRLAGQTDRARLTNEHLARARNAAAEFDIEVSEIEKTIQNYLDFNADLLGQIEKYREDIDAQLARVEAELAAQQARIEGLGREEEEN